MKVEEVEKLLVMFYEAKTTEEQEEALRKYFETHDVPERMELDKKLFLTFRTHTCVDVPSGLEGKLTQMINEKAEEEKRFFIQNKSRRNWRWIGGVAACILVMLSIGYGISNYQAQIHTPKDTFTDPMEAYKAVQEALIEVSTNMNTGLGQLSENRKEIKQVNKEIINEIK